MSPRQWLKKWTDIDPETAIVEVARRYLSAYGPATKNDFARWWGAWPGVGTVAWSGLAGELLPVAVDGVRLDLLATDLDVIRKAKIEDRVQLLPGFDPYLMGHVKRDHLFERDYAPKVSRTAGWISAVMLVDGRVVATWTHRVANKTLRVTIEPFQRLSPEVLAQVKQCAGELAAALGETKADVKVG